MNKRVLLLTSSLLLSSILILIFILYGQNVLLKEGNGFTRNILNPLQLIKISPFSTIERLYASNTNQILLGARDPRWGILTDLSLQKRDTLKININIKPELLLYSDGYMEENFPHIITINTPGLIRYDFDSSNYKIVKLQVPLLTRIAPISLNCMAARAFDSSQTYQNLVKIDTRTGNITKQLSIPELNRDAGYSTDGILTFDHGNHVLIFTQFYQNVFYALDTNLNILYKGKTIDTTNTNLVYTHSLSNKETHMGSLSSAVPLKRIMNDVIAGGGKLYILSTLHADNESPSIAQQNTVVDVYNTKNGLYIGSFYIPKVDNKKVNSLQIINDTLVTLFPDKVATWKLPF